MTDSLYIASIEPSSGKSVIALGLMEILFRRSNRIGYFRPVIPSRTIEDDRIALIAGRYDLPFDYDELFAYTAEEVEQLNAEGRAEEVFKGVLEAYRGLARRCDFVVSDGTDYTGVSPALEFDFNAQVANHLGASVVPVVNGAGKDVEEVVTAVRVARESFLGEGCTLAVTMLNRVAAEDADAVRKGLEEHIPDAEPIFVLPEEPILRMPTVREVADALGAQDLRGDAEDLEREVSTALVAAMSLPNFLDHLIEGALVVAPGDRPDVVLGSLASRLSSACPTIAGVVLSGGLEPDAGILRLVDGLPGTPPPIFLVEEDTYSTARALTKVRAVIRPGNQRKVAAALGVFEEHVDVDVLVDRVTLARADRITPLMFEYDLIERARSDRKHIVLPEGTDERILQAAQLLLRRGVADLTLLGREDNVRQAMASLGLDLDDVPIIDPATSDRLDDFAGRYHELRKHRGVTEEGAYEALLDVNYFATMMVATGAADGMVSGAAHTTAHTIRPAFEIIRTKEGVSTVSSVFLMCLPDRVLVYGDCAVNPHPDAEQLADIAISSAATAERFGVAPRVAMLSYSSGESGGGRAVEAVREATRIAKERRPDLHIDGPIQYDAAVDVSVARTKMPDSNVAGQATVFIFPDLNTGNNTYKAVQRSSGAVAIGPVLQGLNKPVNDLSRGCLVPDIVNTVAITAIQAQGDE
jgi:phosphate acetyltransferase